MVAVIGVVGVRLSVIDLATHRLPNALTYPLWASVVLISLAWGNSAALAGALMGSVLTTLGYGSLACVPGRPLGLGDVKFQASLGWMLGYLSPELAIVGAAGTFVLAGASVLPVLWRERGVQHDPVPLGPWMMLSTCAVVLWAESLKII